METYDPNKSKTEVRQASPRKMNARVLILSMMGTLKPSKKMIAHRGTIDPATRSAITGEAS